MTIIADAKYMGITRKYYTHGSTTKISVKTHLLGNTITVHRVRGHDFDQPQTKLTYSDLGSFLQEWGNLEQILEINL
jgi:hypothetical protein